MVRVAFATLAVAWKVGERTGTPCPFETSGAPALADLEDEHVSCMLASCMPLPDAALRTKIY